MRHAMTAVVLVFLLVGTAAAEEWREVPRILESPHPYPESAELESEISVESARALRVHFERLDMEEDYDVVEILDGRDRVVQTLTGNLTDVWSKEVPGSVAVVRLRSDDSMSFWGYRVDRYAWLPEVVEAPPPAEPEPEPETPAHADAVARIECRPDAVAIFEGQTAEIEVYAFDRRNRPVSPAAANIYWNVHGGGAVLRAGKPGVFRYRAATDAADGATVHLRAYSAFDERIQDEVTVTVRRRPRITGLLLIPEKTVVEAGEPVNFRVLGRVAGQRDGVEIAGWPLRVWASGAGRVEPLRGVGLYRFIPEGNVRDDRRVVLRATLTENARVAVAVPVTVRPRVKLVDLEVTAEPSLVAPGEAVEVRIEGVGDRGDRRPSLAGVVIEMSVEVEGGRRDRSVEIRAPGGEADAIRWTWTAPRRIRDQAEVTFRAEVRGRDGVKGKARVTVARPLVGLDVVPARPRVRAGDALEIRVEGRVEGGRRTVSVPTDRLRVKVDGPGRIEERARDGLFVYRAPGQVNADTRIRIRAELRRGGRVVGETAVVVFPRVELVGLDVRVAKDRLNPGEETEVTVVARGNHPRIPLSADDVDLRLEARPGALRRLRPGTWMYRAPADERGRRLVVLRATAPDEKRISAVATLIVERPGLPADHPIDADDLFVITSWDYVRPVFGGSRGSAPLPKGDTFKARAGEMTFKGKILRDDVRTVRIALERGGTEKVRIYDVDDDNLKAKPDDKGRWTFRFRKEFTHEGEKYAVHLLVTTTSGAVFRQTFYVKPK